MNTSISLDGHAQTLTVDHEYGGRMSRLLSIIHMFMEQDDESSDALMDMVNRVRSSIDRALLATDLPACIRFDDPTEYEIASDVARMAMDVAAEQARYEAAYYNGVTP